MFPRRQASASPLVSGDPFTGLAWPGDGSGNIQTSLDTATQAAQTALAQTPITPPPNFNTPARISADYIMNNGAGSHSATIGTGGTISDLWLLQKNAGNNFTLDEFSKAVLASNPGQTTSRPSQKLEIKGEWRVLHESYRRAN